MIRLAFPPPQRRRCVERSRDRVVRSRRPRANAGAAARQGARPFHEVRLGRRLLPEVRSELPVAVARPRTLATRKLAAGGAVRRWLWARWRPLAPHALPAGLAALVMAFALAFAVAMLHLEAALDTSASSASSSSAP